MATTITNWLRQHHVSVSSHSCAGARASFRTLYCRLTTTTHNNASNQLSISHRAQAHEPLITAATTTNVDDKILRASARCMYIASRDEDDNNTQAPGIFISRRAAATTTTTTIGNNKRRVLDVEASCARKHILITSCDGDEDNKVKRTCYVSSIDAPTSQATSNIEAHELNRQT